MQITPVEKMTETVEEVRRTIALVSGRAISDPMVARHESLVEGH